MSYWFFFSYARDDNKNKAYVRKFFDELEEEVRTLVGVGEVGFFDKEDIPHGAGWPEKLTTALQTSRTFISLFSPTYFSREFCGKEWTVFHSRLELYRKKTGEMPPLLLPVLWIPANLLLPTLPAPLTKLQ
jgi:TIR domain